MAEKSKAVEWVPMARRGLGTAGRRIPLLSNHFKVKVDRTGCDFYQYSVAINNKDGTPVDVKGIGRKVLDNLQENYSADISGRAFLLRDQLLKRPKKDQHKPTTRVGMSFAYDGDKTMFTIGTLPQIKMEFTVVLEDRPMDREILKDFYKSTKQKIKPQHIIIFRDGVSEGQFKQVLDFELEQIIKACKFMMDPSWNPKFTLIVAQKNHHTKFFQPSSPENVPPGTVVDDGVCHPKNYDFYMCSQNGAIGTSRPTHDHVLHDEIGFSPDDLQDLVHSLSYVDKRSTTAIFVVIPIRYAHLAAAQISQFMKFEDSSDRASNLGGEGNVPPMPQLPKLHENVSESMFFC